jgi:hypothetical protein
VVASCLNHRYGVQREGLSDVTKYWHEGAKGNTKSAANSEFDSCGPDCWGSDVGCLQFDRT